MRTLYFLLAIVILVGMCQEDYIISLTAGGCAIGMYYYFKNQEYGKNGKNRRSRKACRTDTFNAS